MSTCLYMILRGRTTNASKMSSIICPDIPSEPEALLGFKLRISFRISSSVITTELIQDSVIYTNSGRTQSLMIKVHCFAKWLLKSLAFSAHFSTKFPLCKIGGIFGALLLFMTR